MFKETIQPTTKELIKTENNASLMLSIENGKYFQTIQNDDTEGPIKVEINQDQYKALENSKEKSKKSEEVEMKFLINPDTLPDGIKNELDQYNPKEITQGYLVIDPETKTEMRVRDKNGKYYQTIKRDVEGSDGVVREEYETEITKDQYEAMIPAAGDRIVEKTRYKIPYQYTNKLDQQQNVTIELDIYKGNKLEGLSTAEIEFPNEEMSDEFIAPNWFGEDKTSDKRYKNQNLATQGKPEEN